MVPRKVNAFATSSGGKQFVDSPNNCFMATLNPEAPHARPVLLIDLLAEARCSAHEMIRLRQRQQNPENCVLIPALSNGAIDQAVAPASALGVSQCNYDAVSKIPALVTICLNRASQHFTDHRIVADFGNGPPDQGRLLHEPRQAENLFNSTGD